MLAVAAEAAHLDNVAALSEATLLRLPPGGDAQAPGPDGTRSAAAKPGAGGTEQPPTPARPSHYLARRAGELAGYAQLHAPVDGPAWADLVVAPPHRRTGIGSALLAALTKTAPAVRVWAHGALPAAQRFAEQRGLVQVRELLLLGRPVDPADAEVAVTLPAEFSVRPFAPADTAEWVQVNARAFADHPEQGRMTEHDLAERARQPWFDPTGFLLLHDTDAPSGPRLAAFHWTKVEHGLGEVYVLGIDPDYQGRRLATPLTQLGLAHLAGRGVSQVQLYVEGDNTAALATYQRAGFHRVSSDLMYARQVG